MAANIRSLILVCAFALAGCDTTSKIATTPNSVAMHQLVHNGRNSEDGVAQDASFAHSKGIAIGNDGKIYVTDAECIRLITPEGIVTTIAGAPGITGSVDGIGKMARFNRPVGIAVDNAGNVYVSDYKNHTIRKITPDGVVATLAGLAGVKGSADGVGTAARFSHPQGIAIDGAGIIYVADHDNHSVRKITPDGMVTTLAGSSGVEGNADGPLATARFAFPGGIAVGLAGSIYVGEYRNIRKITMEGKVTTLAGFEIDRNNWGDKTGVLEKLGLTSALTVASDNLGNIYVADDDTIHKMTPAGIVSTLAGVHGETGIANGARENARFRHPNGIGTDSLGNVYVVDGFINCIIRKITPDGVVTWVAGADYSEEHYGL